jgi:diguanylate cyclase (GGDEF)-like protein
VIRNYFSTHGEDEMRVLAVNKAHAVSQYLGYFEQQIKSLAQITEVHDLVVFGDRAGAQTWALQARQFLPRTVGLAIASADGVVLGEPPALRVGPQCVADLARLQRGQALQRPPVHTDNPALAHFDLTAPITDDSNEVIGILFASFKIDVLQDILVQSVNASQHLELLDGNGRALARAGTLPEDPAAVLHHYDAPVKGSQWTLRLTADVQPPSAIYMVLIVSNLMIWLVVTALVVFTVASITRLFNNELSGIRVLLSRVQEGDFDMTSVPLKLEETAQVVAAIAGIARDIHESHKQLAQQSLTDELTGLSNRRRFTEEYQRDRELAKRGIAVCLVLFDLDGFKMLNDTAGHAAGDQLLRLMGESLQQIARKTDCTARLGGDEFAALLVQMNAASTAAWLERLSSDFEARQTNDPLLSGSARCTFSCGYVQIDPDRDQAIEDAILLADKALYQAKAAGKARAVAAQS